MLKALVLIDNNAFSAKKVLRELRACEKVQKCFMATGAYNIVAKSEGETVGRVVNITCSRTKRLFDV